MVESTTVLFLATVTWLLVHELDAIRNREWRFFFGRTAVSDEAAYRAFTAFHVPAVALVLLSLDSTAFQVGFDAFAVVHGLLHLALRNHPRLAFDGWFSGAWIYGGSLLGGLHLLVLLG